MMDLLDRYLTTVRWNLPRHAKADDILAELRDVISARIEEREDRLDRPLTKDETSALLRDFGHPLVVAARYGGQQWLIGPDVFPFYLFALKVVLAISAAIVIVSAVAHALFAADSVRALRHIGADIFWTLLSNAGIVTLIFAIVERTGWINLYLERWRPEDLPDLRGVGAKPKSAWEAVFEVAVGVALILWWIGVIRVPILYTDVKGLTLTPAPIWADLWAPILALMIARLVFNLVQWLRPRWKAVRALLSVGTAAGGLAVAGLVYHAGRWVTASSTSLPPAQVAEIDRNIDIGIHYAILVFGAVLVVQCAMELWRLYAARSR
jgi:hypothetical protein